MSLLHSSRLLLRSSSLNRITKATTTALNRRGYHEKVEIQFQRCVYEEIIANLVSFFQVIDHYENPRNVGKLDSSKDNVGTGLVGAPACGDVMKLQIEVKREEGDQRGEMGQKSGDWNCGKD